MLNKIKIIFWATLILYLIIVFTMPTLAVYLKYIAIPTIVISGVMYRFLIWKNKD